MERGQHYLADGNLQKAQIEFRNALQIAPQSVEARLMIGRVDEQLGNVRQAAGMYRSVIDLDPHSVPARSSLARLYTLGGEPDRALELVAPALREHPDDPALLAVRGAARAALKDRGDARADAERAVRLAPTNENAVALLASLDVLDGQSDRAVELLRATLVQLPKSVDLHGILARLYVRLGKPDLAAEELAQIVALRPTSLADRVRLAMLYARDKRLEDADRVFREAIAALPNNNEAKLGYAAFLAQFRSPAWAERMLRDFLIRDPRNDGLRLGLGDLQQRDGSVDAALATYRSIVASAEDRPPALEARNRIAAIFLKRNQLDRAVSEITEVLKTDSRNSDALLLRANIALERGDPAAAITDLRAVLREQPRSAGTMRTLARAYKANGQPALAEESLRAAVDAAPTDSGARIELAQLLAETGRMDQAVALLEQGVASFPDDVPQREALVRAYLKKPNLDAARKAAAELEKRAPDRAVGFYLSGLVASAQNREDDAQAELEQALRLQPNAVDALAALARVDVQRGRTEQAIARLTSAAQSAPRDATVQNLLGELLLKSKDYPRAIAQFTRAIELAPHSRIPFANLATAQIASGDVPAAIATYQRAETAAGLDPVLVSGLATLYQREGRIDDAIAQYEAFHRSSPRLTFATNNLAMLLVTYRTDRASLDRARTLTADFMQSSNPDLLDTAAWVRLKSGDLVQALPALEKAAQAAPHSSVIRFHLAMAQLEAGQRDQARSNLESALAGSERFEGWAEARSVLASLKPRSG